MKIEIGFWWFGVLLLTCAGLGIWIMGSSFDPLLIAAGLAVFVAPFVAIETNVLTIHRSSKN